MVYNHYCWLTVRFIRLIPSRRPAIFNHHPLSLILHLKFHIDLFAFVYRKSFLSCLYIFSYFFIFYPGVTMTTPSHPESTPPVILNLFQDLINEMLKPSFVQDYGRAQRVQHDKKKSWRSRIRAKARTFQKSSDPSFIIFLICVAVRA